MLYKVILQTQFGSPHAWTEKYFDNFRMLSKYGWHLKVFTPNPWRSVDNIEIVPMTVEQYDGLMLKHCGVSADNRLVNGVPSKLVSDHYPAYGQIFQDYIKDFHYWGHTNWDVVYGRLDHFLPDSLLGGCEIWSDDVNAINGIFCMYQNSDYVNNLFRNVPNWEESFTAHRPMAFDEIQMTACIRELAAARKVSFGYPSYFPHHSYDRLVQHVPKPNLYFMPDGALIERYEDHISPPSIRDHYGREIMMFHFSRTKQWPI